MIIAAIKAIILSNQKSTMGQVKDANINIITINNVINTIFAIIIITLNCGAHKSYNSPNQFIYNIKCSCFSQPKKKLIIKYTQPN